ncbi:MAG: helix-turn-helix transcriptional regulator [Ruminococcaceae bacterium]|nr:helix-turn-helix transcriptional regulator [Oscillospiraceae bacterium]
MNNIRIAELVIQYRKVNRISQSDFGKLFGVSAQAVSKWEGERAYPDITVLPDLAMVLNCSVNDFFVNKKSQVF